MRNHGRIKQLRDSYRFAGFYPASTVTGVFGDPKARVIPLTRRSKKRLFVTIGEADSRVWSCSMRLEES